METARKRNFVIVLPYQKCNACVNQPLFRLLPVTFVTFGCSHSENVICARIFIANSHLIQSYQQFTKKETVFFPTLVPFWWCCASLQDINNTSSMSGEKWHAHLIPCVRAPSLSLSLWLYAFAPQKNESYTEKTRDGTLWNIEKLLHEIYQFVRIYSLIGKASTEEFSAKFSIDRKNLRKRNNFPCVWQSNGDGKCLSSLSSKYENDFRLEPNALAHTHIHTPAHTHTEHSNAFENVFTLCLKKFIILSLELMPSNLHRTAFI